MTGAFDRCTRCGGADRFRPVHRDIQTPTWMCSHCDAPHRFAQVETPHSARAPLAAKGSGNFPDPGTSGKLSRRTGSGKFPEPVAGQARDKAAPFDDIAAAWEDLTRQPYPGRAQALANIQETFLDEEKTPARRPARKLRQEQASPNSTTPMEQSETEPMTDDVHQHGNHHR
jgi:hypothetical protein